MTTWVRRLLIANVAVFLVQLTYFPVTGWLAFTPAEFLSRPWTLFTYMFAHSPGGIGHIFFNMIGLVVFGTRLESRLGSAHFLRLWVVSGVIAALLSLLLSPTSSIIGASGAVYGVMLAYAMIWPHHRFMIYGILPIEARVLVLLLTAVSITMGVSGGDNVAHFAHLGGFVGGWLYLAFAERFSAVRQWQAKVGAAPSGLEQAGDFRRIDLAAVHAVNREEIERLLAKIEANGEQSLSVPERVFLSHFVPREGQSA